MKAEERKPMILKAAMACFTREGFHQTSMDDIAREAGISAGLIYKYFRNKEDLIEAMVRQNTGGRQWFLFEFLRFGTIRESLDFFFDVMLQRPDWTDTVPLMAQINAEAYRSQKIAKILKEDASVFSAAMTQMIRQAQARGQVDPSIPAEESAYMLLSLTTGLISRLAIENDWDRLSNPVFKRRFKRMFTCFLEIDHFE